MIEACLGFSCDTLRGEIRLESPALPTDVDELRLRRIRVGDGEVDLLLRRHANDVAVNVLHRSGDIRLIVAS
jgi:hypothetical protein